MNFLEKSRSLHNSASELLNKTLLPNYLEKYGHVIYTGSYDLDLMVWPDIDLQIILPEDKPKLDYMLELSRELLLDNNCKNLKLINFSLSQKSKMPRGMYVGMKYKLSGSNIAWKIDMWALDANDQAQSTKFHKKLKEELTDELRYLIIEWKFRIMKNNNLDRMPKLASYFLYQAIIFNRLRSEYEIINYLKSNGVCI